MRADFHEVLIERPRSGMRIKRQPLPRLRTTDWDGEEFAEPTLPLPNRTKWFDDHLSPLKRWLRKQVNRPWDKVYSELSQGIDRRSTVGQHLIDHVKSEVARHCVRTEDGRLVRPDDWTWRSDVEGLYVDPRTGILRWKQRKTNRQHLQDRQRAERERLRDVRWLAPKLLLQRENGIWFELRVRLLRPISRHESQSKVRWAVAKMDIQTTSNALGHYEIIDKRQLNRKELRKHKLSNKA